MTSEAEFRLAASTDGCGGSGTVGAVRAAHGNARPVMTCMCSEGFLFLSVASSIPSSAPVTQTYRFVREKKCGVFSGFSANLEVYSALSRRLYLFEKEDVRLRAWHFILMNQASVYVPS